MATVGPPSRRGSSSAVPRAVAAGLAATLAAGTATALVGERVGGRPAASGAAVGAAMVALFFGLGAVVLHAVTRVAPAASLLVALLTYTLQVVLVGGLSLRLSRSGALDTAVDSRWLGGTVILCTLAWLAAQVAASVRGSRPLHGLPSRRREGRDG